MDLPFQPPIEPMLAKLTEQIPRGEGWQYEPKWDGFRALVFRDRDEIMIQSRDLRPFNRYFPELLGPLAAAIPERCVLDGEIVIAGPEGLDFDSLLLRIHPAASRVRMLAAQDLLALDDRDLRRTPQGERRALLDEALGAARPPIYLTPCTSDVDRAADWFERFEGAGLDGVVAKRLVDPYMPGKRGWAKIKHARTADCVVAGFRWYKNGPGTMVGSLLLGLYGRGTASPGRGAGATAGERPGGPSLGAMGRMGGGGAGLGPEDARRHEPLESRPRPHVGAAAGRASLRGGLRSSPGRQVSPRHDLRPLASGQAAQRLPLRSARDEQAFRAGADIRPVARRASRPGLEPGERRLLLDGGTQGSGEQPFARLP